jgi:peptidoglycan-N-acetylglucosamine deacetylase
LSTIMYFFLKRIYIIRLNRICSKYKILVLTYDDGPNDFFSPKLLKLLKELEVKASFFILGKNVIGNDDILDAIKAEGHDIGSHSYNHLHAWRSDSVYLMSDIKKGFSIIRQWLPDKPLFRPPYGKVNKTVWKEVKSYGASIAWWTIDSGDSKKALPNMNKILKKVKKTNGGVVLMHDLKRNSKDADIKYNFVLKLTSKLVKMARNNNIKIIKYSEFIRFGK